MSIQHRRVLELRNELRLGGVAAQYTSLAQQAAGKRSSFTDFAEELLTAERESIEFCWADYIITTSEFKVPVATGTSFCENILDETRKTFVG
jgi:hypothetical protein